MAALSLSNALYGPDGRMLSEEERRDHSRRTIVWRAVFRVGGDPVQALLRNISVGGVLAELACSLPIGTPGIIEIAPFSPLEASIAWSAGVFHGLTFLAPPALVVQAFGPQARALGLDVPPSS